MTPARSLAASVIALGFASSFTAPLPAFAAPAPCERAENYAAQSGAEMLRIDRIDWHSDADSDSNHERPSAKSSPPGSDKSSSRGESASATDAAQGLLGPGADLTGGDFGDSGQGVTGFLSGTGDLVKSVTDGGVTAPLKGDSSGEGGGGPVETSGHGDGGGTKDASLGGVGLGEARAALIADGHTNSAAVARMVDGKASGKGSLTKPLIQQAPPDNDHAVSRGTPAGTVGPATLGSGSLTAHARWDAAMACGNVAEEAARSAASLGHVDLLKGALIHVPEKISSLSTTALERRGNEPRSVASSTITAGRLTLADGKIKLRVLRAPTLTASMGTGSGGEVQYRPAVVEVSGPGIKTKKLSAAGNSVNISLGSSDDKKRSTESASLGGLPDLSGLLPTSALPLPSVPGLPSLGTPDTESAPAVGDGVNVRISLGAVRQATKSRAVAAKATAIKIAISEGYAEDQDERGKKGYGSSSSLVAEMGLGVLEAAAVAPEVARAGTPAPGSNVGGTAAGLPVTGPQAALIAIGGIGLLAAGGAALLLSRRRRATS
jgi:LPXTG-motif cell wall-anchored protein